MPGAGGPLSGWDGAIGGLAGIAGSPAAGCCHPRAVGWRNRCRPFCGVPPGIDRAATCRACRGLPPSRTFVRPAGLALQRADIIGIGGLDPRGSNLRPSERGGDQFFQRRAQRPHQRVFVVLVAVVDPSPPAGSWAVR